MFFNGKLSMFIFVSIAMSAVILIAALYFYIFFPIKQAHLTQYDHPIEPLFSNKSASPIHSELEKIFTTPDPSLVNLSKKEILQRARKKMDDGGTRIGIPSTIIQGKLNDIEGEWVIFPNSDPSIKVLYIHGGAFYLGSPKSHRIITNKFSEITKGSVFAVDYRLQPETPRLASLEDCKAAYLGLLIPQQDQQSTKEIYIAGDSAGGNLCLALLAWIRDENLPMPTAAICLSPVTDSTISGPSMLKNLAKDAMLQAGVKPLLKLSKSKLLIGGLMANKVKLTDPKISPLFGDLSGLAPTLIQASNTECLEDDARRYTNKARLAGSYVKLQLWAKMMHVWHTFEPELDEAKEAFNEIEKFINDIRNSKKIV